MPADLLVILFAFVALLAVASVGVWHPFRQGPLHTTLLDQIVSLGFVPDGPDWKRGDLRIHRDDDGFWITRPVAEGFALDGSLPVRPLAELPLSVAEAMQLGWLDDEVLSHSRVLLDMQTRSSSGRIELSLAQGPPLADVVRALDGIGRAMARPADLDRLVALATRDAELADQAARTLVDLDPERARSALPALPPLRRLMVATLLDDWEAARPLFHDAPAHPGKAEAEDTWLERVASRSELAARVLKGPPTPDLQLAAALCLNLFDRLPSLRDVRDPELARLALDALFRGGHTLDAVRRALHTTPGWLASRLHDTVSPDILHAVRQVADEEDLTHDAAVAAAQVLVAWGDPTDVLRLRALPLDDATERASLLQERLGGSPGAISVAESHGGDLSVPRGRRLQRE